MTRSTHILLALTICGLAATASAQPVAHLSWEVCSPILTEREHGLEDFYDLVVAGKGIEGTIVGHSARLRLAAGPDAGVPDAWRFDDFGCQKFKLSTPEPGVLELCPGIPSAPIIRVTYLEYDVETAILSILANAEFPEIAPDPEEEYALWVLRFDHRLSYDSSGKPPLEGCGGIQIPVCFRLDGVDLIRPGGERVAVSLGNDRVGWASPTPACDEVQTLSSSWGRVKAIFR